MRSAGGEVADRVMCELRRVVPATFIGRGKVEQIAADAEAAGADFVVFDDELSPSQQRNLEEKLGRMVMDRTGLILDIFAMRARTTEGKLQVELAQLEYLLPRLRGMWTHLSRQGAGIGTRGPGETELETDRRRILAHIAHAKQRLEKVRRTRDLHRKSRRRVPYDSASLVGYTNAGKTTLFNALTGAEAFAAGALFATLDPTVRELHIDEGPRVLLSDTVGFIRKLPHQLVEAFHATLEEVTTADFLIHVIDASHPFADDHIEAVNGVLRELDAGDKDVIHVLNKIDLIGGASLTRLTRTLSSAVMVSARTGEGLDALRHQIARRARRNRSLVTFDLPISEKGLLGEVHRAGAVVNETYGEGRVRIEAWVPAHLAGRLAEYRR